MQQPPRPLTREQLRIIHQRYADGMALLREIKRLREIVVEAARLLPRWSDTDPETVEAVERLSNMLDTEPCVAEAEFDRLNGGRDEIAQKRNGRPRGPGYEVR